MNRCEIGRYRRIGKAEARKRFEAREETYWAACKMNPDSIWQPVVMITNESGESWDTTYNAFLYYNCTNETGRYISFYIKEEK